MRGNAVPGREVGRLGLGAGSIDLVSDLRVYLKSKGTKKPLKCSEYVGDVIRINLTLENNSNLTTSRLPLPPAYCNPTITSHLISESTFQVPPYFLPCSFLPQQSAVHTTAIVILRKCEIDHALPLLNIIQFLPNILRTR